MPYASEFETVDANPAAYGHWATKSFDANAHWEMLLPPKVAKFDWRAHGLAPLVRNQGAWNACTSFAITAVIEARRHLRGLATPRLSAGYVHFCRLGETDINNGKDAPVVAAVAANSGVMPGAVDGPPLDQRQCTLDQTVAIRIIGSGYVEPGAKSLNRLVGEGPLLVGVYMPDNFDTISAHDIFRIGHPEKVALHSMMLVGYDWAAQTITMLGSNGPLWGNGGYVTMDMTEADFFGRWPFGVTV